MKISIVSPVLDEEEIIEDFYTSLKRTIRGFDCEIIFTDDGSTDKTKQILEKLRQKDPRIKIVRFKKNTGQQNAILAGLKSSNGDIAIVLDADLQDDPAYIPKLIERWQNGAKIVFAKRAKRKDSYFKQITAFFYYRSLKILNPDIVLDAGDFYLLDRQVIERIKSSDQKYLFLRGVLGRLPFIKDEIYIERGRRQKGKSGYPLRKMLSLAWNGIMFSLSHPAPDASPKNLLRGKTACIVGGGISGLVTGYLLAKEGMKVTVIEQSPELGGLLKTIKIANGKNIEKYYHHIFKTDRQLLDLLEELGLGDKLKWYESKTSLYKDKKFYGFSKPTDLLKAPLTFKTSTKMGIVSILLNKSRSERFTGITAKELILKYMGKESWDVLWEPLFKGKFGEYSKDISAVWFWWRLKSRTETRKNGREILGYMEGSFKTLVDKLALEIKKNGGGILMNRPWTKADNDRYDYVVSTVAPGTAADIAPLSEEEKQKLKSIKYIGAICSVLELKSKLTDYYWNNILDEDMPFKGLIEHTNLVGTESYGGNHIVYLSHYTSNDSEYFKMNEEELKKVYLKHLKKMFPDTLENIITFKIFKSGFAQPIIPPNYIPPAHQTSIPNFYLTSMAHIYPEDRGINQAVKEAYRISKLIIAKLSQNGTQNQREV